MSLAIASYLKRAAGPFLKVPAADGAEGEALITDGAGNLSFAAPEPAAHDHDGDYDTLGAATTAVAAHAAAGDPHPQYLTTAEGNAAYDALGAASGVNTSLGNHLSAASAAHAASAIAVTAAGGIAATDVQAALQELDSEKAATGHHHDAAYQPLDAQLTSLAGLSYSGNSHKVVRVNTGETAFELASPAAGGSAEIDINSQAGNYTLLSTDQGDLVDFTAAATLTLPAAATAGDRFSCLVRNSASVSSLVVVDGNGSETIDGVLTLTLHAGEVRLLICDGSGWRTIQSVPPRAVVTPPDDSQFSWVNQDGATIAQARAGLAMSATGAGGDMNARIRIKSLPATPYSVTAAFQFLFDPSASSQRPAVGIVLRQSSDGKLVAFDVNHQGNTAGSPPVLNWRVAKWNSPTTSSPTVYAERANLMPPGTVLLWLRITDDGSQRKCWVSANGDDWIQYGSNVAGTHTDFMTADQVGWFINPYNASIVATLASWKES